MTISSFFVVLLCLSFVVARSSDLPLISFNRHSWACWNTNQAQVVSLESDYVKCRAYLCKLWNLIAQFMESRSTIRGFRLLRSRDLITQIVKFSLICLWKTLRLTSQCFPQNALFEKTDSVPQNDSIQANSENTVSYTELSDKIACELHSYKSVKHAPSGCLHWPLFYGTGSSCYK